MRIWENRAADGAESPPVPLTKNGRGVIIVAIDRTTERNFHTMAKMWAGRTDGHTDQIADDFNSSIHFVMLSFTSSSISMALRISSWSPMAIVAGL